MLRIINLLFITLLFTACGKKYSTSPASFKLVTGANYMTVPHDGGVLVMGRSTDGKYSFVKNLLLDSDYIDLAQGTWEFFAIVWEGSASLSPGASKNLTGLHKCAYSGLFQVKGTEVNINLTLSEAACSTPVSDGKTIADSTFMNGTQFFEFNLKSCSEVPATLSGSSCAASNFGKSKSIQIKIPDRVELNGSSTITGTGLVSRCINDYEYSSSVNHLRLPLASSGTNGFLGFEIYSYDTYGCAGTMQESRFDSKSTSINKVTAFDAGAGAKYLFFPHYNPYGGIAIDSSFMQPAPVFNTCEQVGVRLLDQQAASTTALTSLSGSISFTGNGVFYSDNTCSPGGVLGSYTSFTIPAGQSSANIYFKSFSKNTTINAYLDAFYSTYTIATDTTPYNYATIDYNYIVSMLGKMDATGIGNAHTTLITNDIILLKYDNLITKIQVVSISASSILFNFTSYTYPGGGTALATGTSITLLSANNESCDFSQPTCVLNTTYHATYNSINFFNIFATGVDRGLFYLY